MGCRRTGKWGRGSGSVAERWPGMQRTWAQSPAPQRGGWGREAASRGRAQGAPSCAQLHLGLAWPSPGTPAPCGERAPVTRSQGPLRGWSWRHIWMTTGHAAVAVGVGTRAWTAQAGPPARQTPKKRGRCWRPGPTVERVGITRAGGSWWKCRFSGLSPEPPARPGLWGGQETFQKQAPE